ncbi:MULTISPECIES: Zn-ribbon domain-containing OB-fold protein [unclassified Rhodococcus (in: high G+C Gram-positive bacteria)]|uniref:Zn-ribbon domain-containing OB-fold protein n=1 Tax=unclassified Rhodococcus (in: high G+C Gram-positive bacteria) TaxID=192944 RepID=UPI0015C631A2|nr:MULTISPECIES: OB-fold domain-containing protein [unclassified Rhodococcus (in: high G+C Gram-positive bacteria)]
MSTRPLPVPSSWSAPFWKATADHKLTVQKCVHSGELLMYPRLVSPFSLTDELEWIECSGRGEVYTYTIQEAGAPSGFEDALPYVIAVVKLEEGPQLMTNIVGPDRLDVRCGSTVQVTFEGTESSDIVLPMFELVTAS